MGLLLLNDVLGSLRCFCASWHWICSISALLLTNDVLHCGGRIQIAILKSHIDCRTDRSLALIKRDLCQYKLITRSLRRSKSRCGMEVGVDDESQNRQEVIIKRIGLLPESPFGFSALDSIERHRGKRVLFRPKMTLDLASSLDLLGTRSRGMKAGSPAW
jgi:hypothetical protein